jgi:hypothetical protein
MFFQRKGYFGEPSALLLLMLLVSVDCAFIALHIATRIERHLLGATLQLNYDLLSITTDGGYSELYQYVKYFWVIILTLYLSRVARAPHYVAWTVLFAYFLCDDALSIHERVGAVIGQSLHFVPPLNLRLQDFGELAVTAMAGGVLLPLLLWSYRGGSDAFKKIAQDLLVLVFALVFFGVVVDVAHQSMKLGWAVEFIMGIIEDGGEMVALSLIVWYVFLLSVHKGIPGSHFCDLLRVTQKKAPPDIDAAAFHPAK